MPDQQNFASAASELGVVYSKHGVNCGGLLKEGAAKCTCGRPCVFAGCNEQTA